MKKYVCLGLLTLPLLLTGCDRSDASLVGHWTNEEKDCMALCSFTIREERTADSEYIIEFKGTMSYPASGPLIDKGEGYYLVKGHFMDYEMVLKDGVFYHYRLGAYRQDKPQS